MLEFAKKWGMKINANKTNYIVLQKKYKTKFNIPPKLSLTMNKIPISKDNQPVHSVSPLIKTCRSTSTLLLYGLYSLKINILSEYLVQKNTV